MRVQDFSKKMVIVVRDDLPHWQAMNAVAHAVAYIGNKMSENFDTGEFFVTKDGINHPRNTQYPIVILSARQNELGDLIDKVRKAQLLYLGFFREMIETTDDAEIEKILAAKSDSEIEYLGVGIFGDKEQVSALTKQFDLWK